MNLLRRLKAWFLRRFHHRDWTRLYEWPLSRKPDEPWSYCSVLGHKWGGWRREKERMYYTRRCRRRRCGYVEEVSHVALLNHALSIKGGQMWRRP